MHKHVSMSVPCLCSPSPCLICCNCTLKYETEREVSKIVFQENELKETSSQVGKGYNKESHLVKHQAEITSKPIPKSINQRTNLQKAQLLLPELRNLLAKPGERQRPNTCVSAAVRRKARQLSWLTLQQVGVTKLSSFLARTHNAAVSELRQLAPNTGAEGRMPVTRSQRGLCAQASTKYRPFERWVPLSGPL